MNALYLGPGLFPHDLFADTYSYIRSLQKSSGEILWFDGGHTDPWDHIEAAMALSIGGYFEDAERAYEWLKTFSWMTEVGGLNTVMVTREISLGARPISALI
jgi:hypothetical protein